MSSTRSSRDERPTQEVGRSDSPQSDECKRAQTYADMARDARDAAERQELNDRARRYCPTLAGLDGGHGDVGRRPVRQIAEDPDTPLDTY